MTEQVTAPRRLADGWMRPAVSVAAIGAGANVFVPLIVLYRAQGVTALATEVMFALYAVGLIPALLVGGRWSDRTSRRVVVATALVISALASSTLVVGAVWHPALFVGRFLAGASSGLAFGTGAAWIRELSSGHADAHVGARRATVAMTVGFGGGSLVAGIIAQWAPHPQVLPYIPHLLSCAVALLLLRGADPGHRRSRAHRPAAPRSDRALAHHLLVVCVPFAPWVFGTASIGLAYLPGLVVGHAGGQPLAFAAVATALPAVTGVLVQPVVAWVAARRAPERLLVLAMILVVVSLTVAVAAAAAATVWAVLVAAAVLGAAYGAAQYVGMADVQHTAHPDQLGIATSSYQAISYLGFALPYLLTLSHVRWAWSPDRGLGAVTVLALVATAWLAMAQRLRRARAETATDDSLPQHIPHPRG